MAFEVVVIPRVEVAVPLDQEVTAADVCLACLCACLPATGASKEGGGGNAGHGGAQRGGTCPDREGIGQPQLQQRPCSSDPGGAVLPILMAAYGQQL